MAVDEEQIEPTVVININETAAPAEPARINAHTRGKRHVIKHSFPGIVVKRGGIAREVGLENVEPAVAVIVAGCHAHAGLRLAIDTESAASFDPYVGKSAVPVIVVQSRGR